MITHKLPKEFTGTGEVKDFQFTQIRESDTAYLYRVSFEGSEWFEVFRKVTAPVCIDFENRIYSITEQKEVYPKQSQFGVSAWCVKSLRRAENKFKQQQP